MSITTNHNYYHYYLPSTTIDYSYYPFLKLEFDQKQVTFGSPLYEDNFIFKKLHKPIKAENDFMSEIFKSLKA